MKLMKDTASLTNYILGNTTTEKAILPGETFCELLWTDRVLWIVTRTEGPGKFFAARVKTSMPNGWADGTEVPILDDAGKVQHDGGEECYRLSRHKWKRNDHKVNLAFGQKCGYRDPSF